MTTRLGLLVSERREQKRALQPQHEQRVSDHRVNSLKINRLIS